MLEGTTPPASPHSLNPAVSFAAHKRGCFWNSGEIRHGGLFWGWGKYCTNRRTCEIQNVAEAGDRNEDGEKRHRPRSRPSRTPRPTVWRTRVVSVVPSCPRSGSVKEPLVTLFARGKEKVLPPGPCLAAHSPSRASAQAPESSAQGSGGEVAVCR